MHSIVRKHPQASSRLNALKNSLLSFSFGLTVLRQSLWISKLNAQIMAKSTRLFVLPQNLFQVPWSICAKDQNTVIACGRPHRGMLNGRQISIACVFPNHSRLILSGIFGNPWELWGKPVVSHFITCYHFPQALIIFQVKRKIIRRSKKSPSKFDSLLYTLHRPFGLSNNHHKERGKQSC